MVGTRSPQPRPDGAREQPYSLDPGFELEGVLAGVEGVIHLATDPFRSRRDVAGTAGLLEAAAASGTRHLLYVSIVGIDDHPYPYYRAKAACEQLIEKGPVPWTILRATQFHSLTKTFADQFRRAPVVLFPSGIPFQPVDGDTVAERVVELVTGSPRARAEDVGGPDVLDLKTSIEQYLRATGSHKPVWPLPVLGASIRAFRSGALLTPNKAGGRSFAEWLAELSTG